MAINNPKGFWREIRKLKGSASSQNNIDLSQFHEHFKQIYSDNSNFASEHVEQFIHRNFNNGSNDHPENGRPYDTSLLDEPITCSEVIKAISKLKRNKSPGSDLLPPELFIDTADLLSDVLCKLFNYIFENNLYPDSWTHGICVPVPKKGDLSDVNNYRGITLTSIFSKIYSHILDNRLRAWVDDNRIINECQFGFMQNKSTVDCLFILQSIVNNQLFHKRKLYCAFIDFQKAFDLIYRNGIWYKLCEIGASLKFVKSIKAIYNSVKICVRSMGKLSDCFDSLVGVKQGEPLSPLLFILFLNDISDELRINVDRLNINNNIIEEFQKFILLFADDTLLLAEELDELQNMLNQLSVYCKKWNITVNVNKTKVMLFKCSNRPENFEVLYEGSSLENVSNFLYLGVNVASNGKFYQAQKHLSEQASKALFSLNKLFSDNILCVQDKLKLFDSLILPILTYGCEIWGFYRSDDIEKVHLRFLKQILGVRRQTSNIAVYGELGRFPLYIIRKIRILKYWFKILNSPNSLLFKVYCQQVNCLNNNASYSCWCTSVRTLLNELGFSYLWDSQSVSKLQLEKVIQMVYDQYYQSWYSDLNLSNKLDTIKSLNKIFCFEKYISCISNDRHRIALSRFRCSAHKLMIEEGRYRNIERNNRLCKCCNMNFIEDEFHFLLICPAFRDIRMSILPKYYCRWPSKQKFIKLLGASQTGILKKIGKYIYLANEKRINLLK
ncbi:MAG: reverse transcriptase family protein [Candidatus Thiodiazotropha sp.]